MSEETEQYEAKWLRDLIAAKGPDQAKLVREFLSHCADLRGMLHSRSEDVKRMEKIVAQQAEEKKRLKHDLDKCQLRKDSIEYALFLVHQVVKDREAKMLFGGDSLALAT